MKNQRKYVLLLLVAIAVVITAMLGVAVLSSSAGEVQQIKPEGLRKLIESNDPNILVVDVQPKGAYDLGHIKGAVNFPWAMDIESPGTLPRDKMLILYCDCAHEETPGNLALQLTSSFGSCASDDDSVSVAEQLMSKFGYKNINVLEGGWSKWQQLGYPVDKK